MSDLAMPLQPKDRQAVERMAKDAGVSVEAMAAAMIARFLDLMRDAPAALPRDPMRGLSIAAAKRRARQ